MKNRSKNEVEYRHRFLIDFWSIVGQFLEPKSLQNRLQSCFGRALNEDSVSKLKKERAESIGRAQTSPARLPPHSQAPSSSRYPSPRIQARKCRGACYVRFEGLKLRTAAIAASPTVSSNANTHFIRLR